MSKRARRQRTPTERRSPSITARASQMRPTTSLRFAIPSPLLSRESCLERVTRHLRRKHHSRLGAERHRKLADEHVRFRGRERDRERLAGVLNHGAAAEPGRRRRTLAVVLQDVEGDLLALGDELDRMTLPSRRPRRRSRLCRRPVPQRAPATPAQTIAIARRIHIPASVSRFRRAQARSRARPKCAPAPCGQRRETASGSERRPAASS